MTIYEIVTYSVYDGNWMGYTGDLYLKRENAIDGLADWKKIWEGFIKYGVVLVEDNFESFSEFRKFCELKGYKSAVGIIELETND